LILWIGYDKMKSSFNVAFVLQREKRGTRARRVKVKTVIHSRFHDPSIARIGTKLAKFQLPFPRGEKGVLRSGQKEGGRTTNDERDNSQQCNE
jgi:hypothetical protein